MAAYARLAPWLPPYDPLAWEREALAPWEEAVHEGAVADGPRRTPAPLARLFAWRVADPGTTFWHRFQEAARDHLRLGMRLFAPALEAAGLETDLPEVLANLMPAPAAPEPEPGLNLADLADLADLWPGEDDEDGADAPDTENMPVAGVRSEP
jgi:hypothetical protein